MSGSELFLEAAEAGDLAGYLAALSEGQLRMLIEHVEQQDTLGVIAGQVWSECALEVLTRFREGDISEA